MSSPEIFLSRLLAASQLFYTADFWHDPTSLRSSLFRFLSGKQESREGMETEITKKKTIPSVPNFLPSPHAFTRLPLSSRFLPLRGVEGERGEAGTERTATQAMTPPV